MGATDIFRPYRGGQAILRVIRPAQGLRFIAERRHADYRTKHFALDNSVFLPGAGEQRRLEVIARAVSPTAAGDHLNVRQRPCGFHRRANALKMGQRAQRTQFGGSVLRRPHFQAGHRRPKFLHQLVIDTLLGVDPAGGRAVLAGVVKTEGPHPIHHRIDVRIVKKDHWRLTAQLHVGAFNRRGGMANDMGSGGNRSGQGDHSHFNVGGQGVAHRFTTAKQHVDNPLREDIFCQLRQLQRRQRGDLRGFYHYAVARRQRRGQLPGRHHQRIVPRRDGGHHAHRIAADH